MNNHLANIHGVTKKYPEGHPIAHTPGQASSSRIVAAFASMKPQFEFNSNTFQRFLIRWIFVTNTPFQAVEDPTFRALLTYLLCCVRKICTYFDS